MRKDGKTSYIGLKTYFEYEGDRPPEVDPNNLPQADFLVDSGTTLPRSGKVYLYGFRRSRALLGYVMGQAMEHGASIEVVEIQHPIGEWQSSKMRLADIGVSKFLNLPERVNADVLNDVQYRWARLLDRHGLAQDGFPRKPSKHMHLLDDLIKEKPYDQLTAIGFPVHTKVGWVTAVCIIP